MDCHSVNVYKQEDILSSFLYTTHLYFLVIRTYSMFTPSYEKILQIYCLDSVSSGCWVGHSRLHMKINETLSLSFSLSVFSLFSVYLKFVFKHIPTNGICIPCTIFFHALVHESKDDLTYFLLPLKALPILCCFFKVMAKTFTG